MLVPPNVYIGNPKLFMGGEASGAELERPSRVACDLLASVFMVFTITRTAGENKTQSIANGGELRSRQIEVNENLVQMAHLVRCRFVEPQNKAVAPKQHLSDASVDDVPLNRNLNINSLNPRNALLCASASLQQQPVEGILVSRITGEADRDGELALIYGGVMRNELMA
jgi:hypothetical protein